MTYDCTVNTVDQSRQCRRWDVEGTSEFPMVEEVRRAEAKLLVLKDQIRVGWDKVTIQAIHDLESALYLCMRGRPLHLQQRERVMAMIAAAEKAWEGMHGIKMECRDLRAAPVLEGAQKCSDAEFNELCAKADTLVEDLRAVTRILCRRMVDRLPSWLASHIR